MSAESGFERKTIIGPVDKTIHDFLRDAPMGSSLTITGENSVESVTVVEFSLAKELAKTASALKDQASRTIFEAGIIFRDRVTSSPKTP